MVMAQGEKGQAKWLPATFQTGQRGFSLGATAPHCLQPPQSFQQQ
jgi:hypothetical protein